MNESNGKLSRSALSFEGWIFDSYPVRDGISLWVINERGQMHVLLDPWMPRFFVASNACSRATIATFIERAGVAVTLEPTERRDLFSNDVIAVWDVHVRNPLQYATLVGQLQRLDRLELFNCDIPLVQTYHYERRHFPLARCEFETTLNQTLLRHHLKDSPWDVNYEYPPLRFMHLSIDNASQDPNHAPKGRLMLTLGEKAGEGSCYIFEETEPEELLEGLNRHLVQWDPDVILSDWGDSYILPRLRLLSARTGMALNLSRSHPSLTQSGVPALFRKSPRSFHSFGKMVYQGGPHYLFGRWHLDCQNSFTLRHSGLEGLIEIARLAKIPVQQAARCTIGTSLSSMQLDRAESDGVLVPRHKQQTEDFRDGMSLLSADRGGLVYAPEPGWHEEIAEIDFVSMYPAVMVHYNISPETVNCACCPDNAVPGSPHHLCRKRRGLIPRTLENILTKRARYKQLAKSAIDPALRLSYKHRADAHKWALVTSFGYLGFKNARFGKIEAHECVNAYGREILLRAKEIAEDAGFHMVHAIVDSLWIKRPGAGRADFQALADTISRITQFPIALEGVYDWLCFCASKEDSKLGVPNRYFGCFDNKELKLRGIEIRRHDTPPFFKRFQEDLLASLIRAKNLAECRALEPELAIIFEAYQDRLRTGNVSALELAFTSNLSKEPQDYKHDTYSSIAARQLAASGVTLHAGEPIQYIIASARDKVKDWRVIPLALVENHFEYDPVQYEELLKRAYQTLTAGLALQKRPSPTPQALANHTYV